MLKFIVLNPDNLRALQVRPCDATVVVTNDAKYAERFDTADAADTFGRAHGVVLGAWMVKAVDMGGRS